MASETTDGELTSSMGSVLSTLNKDDKSDSSDSTPTSSTDANTTASTSQIVTDDPISSTSSDVQEAIKTKEAQIDHQTSLPEPTCDKGSSDTMAASNSLLVSDADLLCMNITDVSDEKITEDVEDIVQDLENLLGESSTTAFSKSSLPEKQVSVGDIPEKSAELQAQQEKILTSKEDKQEDDIEKRETIDNVDTKTDNLIDSDENPSQKVDTDVCSQYSSVDRKLFEGDNKDIGMKQQQQNVPQIVNTEGHSQYSLPEEKLSEVDSRDIEMKQLQEDSQKGDTGIQHSCLEVEPTEEKNKHPCEKEQVTDTQSGDDVDTLKTANNGVVISASLSEKVALENSQVEESLECNRTEVDDAGSEIVNAECPVSENQSEMVSDEHVSNTDNIVLSPSVENLSKKTGGDISDEIPLGGTEGNEGGASVEVPSEGNEGGTSVEVQSEEGKEGGKSVEVPSERNEGGTSVEVPSEGNEGGTSVEVLPERVQDDELEIQSKESQGGISKETDYATNTEVLSEGNGGHEPEEVLSAGSGGDIPSDITQTGIPLAVLCEETCNKKTPAIPCEHAQSDMPLKDSHSEVDISAAELKSNISPTKDSELTQENTNKSDHHANLNVAQVDDELLATGAEVRAVKKFAYVCGPDGFKDQIVDNCPKEQLHIAEDQLEIAPVEELNVAEDGGNKEGTKNECVPDEALDITPNKIEENRCEDIEPVFNEVQIGSENNVNKELPKEQTEPPLDEVQPTSENNEGMDISDKVDEPASDETRSKNDCDNDMDTSNKDEPLLSVIHAQNESSENIDMPNKDIGSVEDMDTSNRDEPLLSVTHAQNESSENIDMPNKGIGSLLDKTQVAESSEAVDSPNMNIETPKTVDDTTVDSSREISMTTDNELSFEDILAEQPIIQSEEQASLQDNLDNFLEDTPITIPDTDINTGIAVNTEKYVTEPDATTSLTEPDATISVAEPDATISVTESDATISVAEADATISVAEPDGTISVAAAVVGKTDIAEYKASEGVSTNNSESSVSVELDVVTERKPDSCSEELLECSRSVEDTSAVAQATADKNLVAAETEQNGNTDAVYKRSAEGNDNSDESQLKMEINDDTIIKETKVDIHNKQESNVLASSTSGVSEIQESEIIIETCKDENLQNKDVLVIDMKNAQDSEDQKSEEVSVSNINEPDNSESKPESEMEQLPVSSKDESNNTESNAELDTEEFCTKDETNAAESKPKLETEQLDMPSNDKSDSTESKPELETEQLPVSSKDESGNTESKAELEMDVLPVPSKDESDVIESKLELDTEEFPSKDELHNTEIKPELDTEVLSVSSKDRPDNTERKQELEMQVHSMSSKDETDNIERKSESEVEVLPKSRKDEPDATECKQELEIDVIPVSSKGEEKIYNTEGKPELEFLVSRKDGPDNTESIPETEVEKHLVSKKGVFQSKSESEIEGESKMKIVAEKCESDSQNLASKNLVADTTSHDTSKVAEPVTIVGKIKDKTEKMVSEITESHVECIQKKTGITDSSTEQPLLINIDDNKNEKTTSFSPKIIIKPPRSPVRESSMDPDDKEETKGSLKMTITKQSDTMHSILKVYNPDEENANTSRSEDNEVNFECQEPSIPKLIIKPVPEKNELPLSPKMVTRSSKVIPNTTQRSSSPRITIKPIVKPESHADVVSPLKITISKSKNDDTLRQKHSPKPSTRSSKVEIDVGKDHHSPRKSGRTKQADSQEPIHSPRVTIKPIVKPPEEPDQITNPKITIKPIPKPSEAESTSAPSPRVTIKPVLKPQENSDVEIAEPVEKTNPKITIKPLLKPNENENQEAECEDAVKERIVLKINKSRKRDLSEEDRSEKLGKIKLKFSKEGGHPHIVQQSSPEASHKRLSDSDYDQDKCKRQKIDNEATSTTTDISHSKLKDILSNNPRSSKTQYINEETVCSDDVNINKNIEKTPLSVQDSSNAKMLREDLNDPLSQIPVFEITPEGAKTMSQSSVPQVSPSPSSTNLPKKRGRPRKVPLQIREDFKDEIQQPTALQESQVLQESTRPKRSCRGQSARTTLGIKPRKPRGAGGARSSRGGRRGRGGRGISKSTRVQDILSDDKVKSMKESISALAEEAKLIAFARVQEANSNADLKFNLPGPTSLEGSLAQSSTAPTSTVTTDSAEIVMFEDETRMSADISRAQTPAKQIVIADIEESQSSVLSSATTESAKGRKGPRLEVHQEPEGAVISADQLAEYCWGGAGPFMLQEQVAQFLGIKSFKRKYPNIQRRTVDMQERDFIRESGLASEAMCDLGLTAVNSADILDILYTDFQDKYEEYCKHQRDRQAKDLINKQKALSLAASQEKNKLDITEQAVHSAALWNAGFNKTRREQRRACMDLQTLTVHYPKGRIKQIPRDKVGNYPVALVPGQFTDYYKEFTPTEINNLPLNTMCYEPINRITYEYMECDSQSDDSGTGSDSSSSSSDSSDSDSSDAEDCKICKSSSASKVAPVQN